MAQDHVVGRFEKEQVNLEKIGLKDRLQALYICYNKRKYVEPDPLQFLYKFKDKKEREVAGIICASLAFGRVHQIIKAISICLEKMNMQPRTFLLTHEPSDIKAIFSDFSYRFIKAREMACFLTGVKIIIDRYGSLEGAFSFARPKNRRLPVEVADQLSAFVEKILEASGIERSYLLPNPMKKSACKRLFLFLRWMVRNDQVDPGGWRCLEPKDLLVPLDTHMFNISRTLGLTSRKQPDLATAIEITRGFSKICPEDPVRYDFVLTRFGIRDELSLKELPSILKLDKGQSHLRDS